MALININTRSSVPAFVMLSGAFNLSNERNADPICFIRNLIPVLIFSFPGIVLGWPTLGALGRIREVTATTIFAADFQVLGIIGLIITGFFDLMSLAILRAATEFVLFAGRAIIYMVKKRRNTGYGD